MTWSPQQELALRAVATWRSDRYGQQVFNLSGYAGTGKTTLAVTIHLLRFTLVGAAD